MYKGAQWLRSASTNQVGCPSEQGNNGVSHGPYSMAKDNGVLQSPSGLEDVFFDTFQQAESQRCKWNEWWEQLSSNQ